MSSVKFFSYGGETTATWFCKPTPAMYSLGKKINLNGQFVNSFYRPVTVGCPHIDQRSVPQCGHLDIVLNNNEHFSISPGPGIPPGRHDAHVGVRGDDSFGAVTEFEVPGHISHQVPALPPSPIYSYLESDPPAGIV